jgi:hypothetical protein
MKHPLARAAVVLAATTAAGAMAIPAASAEPLPVPVQHPAEQALTLMINRPDDGAGGNWAHDTFVRQAEIGAQVATATLNCGVSAKTCFMISGATLTDTNGSFTTIRDAFTPNQGAPFAGDHIRHVVDGSLAGTVGFGTFFATALPSAKNVPEFSVGANNPSGTWPELFFPPGTTFTGVSEGPFHYTYLAPGERWVDSSTNDDGQVPSAGNITG